MLTNFHLPQSSLLMLVVAFAGKERVLSAYQHAVQDKYRVFSYGDAMLLTPDSSSGRLQLMPRTVPRGAAHLNFDAAMCRHRPSCRSVPTVPSRA